MEVNLRLDANGRTTWEEKRDNALNIEEVEAAAEVPTSTSTTAELDYTPKASMTSHLVPPEDKSGTNYEKWRTWMDNILFDCEISDCGLMPRTFWMPANGTKPRCALEQMALSVFHHHVPSGYSFDPATSGAEWWVQLRPSPPGMGRYAMHDDSPADDMSTSGISFHWDKDEDLRLLAGGSLYVHPHLSTVTYMTSLGAPTMVLNCRINTFTGEWIVPDGSNGSEPCVEGFLSWPKQGKHLSFDGRFLHAAPPDLMKDGAFEEQCKIPIVQNPTTNGIDDSDVERRKKILKRRHRRVTFLVNIWLNYKPFNVDPFPDTMLDKLTGVQESEEFALFETPVTSVCSRNVSICGSKVTNATGTTTETFEWPMGNCDSGERIQVETPKRIIQAESSLGGNVRIQWRRDDLSGPGAHKIGVMMKDPKVASGTTPSTPDASETRANEQQQEEDVSRKKARASTD